MSTDDTTSSTGTGGGSKSLIAHLPPEVRERIIRESATWFDAPTDDDENEPS